MRARVRPAAVDWMCAGLVGREPHGGGSRGQVGLRATRAAATLARERLPSFTVLRSKFVRLP